MLIVLGKLGAVCWFDKLCSLACLLFGIGFELEQAWLVILTRLVVWFSVVLLTSLSKLEFVVLSSFSKTGLQVETV